DQQVAVVANYSSSDVSIMRATPVVVADPSLHNPLEVAVGPTLPPAAQPRHTSLGFTYKLCGDTSIQTAKIVNVGPGHLKLGTLSLSGASKSAFSVYKNTCSDQMLVSGAACTISVKFVALKDVSAKGVFSAAASIVSNDPLAKLIGIDLVAK